MILTPVLTWVGYKVSVWVGTLEANEKSGGMLARLTDSIFVAVKKVNQTLKAKILDAKDPTSAGGEKITDDEAQELKEAVWDELRSYWGTKGLAAAGKILGLDNLTRFIDGKIEAAVSDLKEPKANP
jgi:hypothetical protein